MAVHPSNTSRRGSREHDGPSATTGLYGWLATGQAYRPTLQVAHRIRVARRMLEANQTIAETAAATGFADQSHLHRHFVDGLWMTPGEDQRRFKT